MTEENTPAATPVEHYQEQQPAEQTPAHQEHYREQPAETPEHENYEEHFTEEQAEEPADLGEILEDRPKKLSGAQRAKLQRQYLENELREREQRIEALERHISQGDDRSDDDRRKRNHGAHLERLKDARGAIADFDVTMSKMAGVAIHDDLIDEIVSSDKSPLLAYHLAKNPDKLRELNSMSTREMAREIGRLEASVKLPVGKKQTTAPPPPTTLRGGAAPHTALEQVSDMDEFASRLMKDLAKRERR
jgi:hypothetical protein